MKTLDGWHEYANTTGKSNWYDYCMPGDEIDADVYDYFLDILPPVVMRRGYFQVGEPYDHRPDDSGKWLATYATFCKRREDDGSIKCYYLGHCFAGGRENVA